MTSTLEAKSLKTISYIFTVGEAVRSTCGNSHEKEEEEDHFHLSLHQTIL